MRNAVEPPERRMDMAYIDLIKERARIDKKTIVLPESNRSEEHTSELQ